MGRPPDCHCNCEPVDPPDPTEDCVACLSVAAIWNLAVAGVSGFPFGCNGCVTHLNGNFQLIFCGHMAAGYCEWQVFPRTGICLTTGLAEYPWQLRVYDSPIVAGPISTYAVLCAGARYIADPPCNSTQGFVFTYRLLTPFNCLGPNTFSLLSSSGCATSATTLTVSPAP